MAGSSSRHSPVSPAFDICDVNEHAYQIHERADQIHDDFLRPFNQDEEERTYDAEVKSSIDITYDPQVQT